MICECGVDFERPEEFAINYNKYKDECPSAARLYKRKITLCDKCNEEFMNKSLRVLPDVLKAISNA